MEILKMKKRLKIILQCMLIKIWLDQLRFWKIEIH